MRDIPDKIFKDQILNNVLTVDPGYHTGYAYWRGNLLPETGQFNLSKLKKITTLEREIIDLSNKFTNIILNLKPKIVYIEGVEFWDTSMKSLMAAKRQDLFKLSYLVGSYFNICYVHYCNVFIIPARKWKGQIKYEVLQRKIYRINKNYYDSDHITNAVGIGFSVMGLLQNTKNQPGKFLKNRLDCFNNV